MGFIGTLIAVGMAGAGVGMAVGASGGGDSKGPAAATPVDPTKAAEDAQAAQTRQRQILLATGGQTDMTGGSASILGSDTSKHTLLGG